ncbi:GntR family transcriptional regulator [Acuticoccus sp. M5D2P5]|uniref:GntR family transcriptional regulator n=1 Tax=Acuticoccus kalidii TaxID=2910977 RepID=UPI001F1774F3|nr:GntR family transcriptional regulator [Acuticoccus kalidii]MCF3935853.1 GntR family transcriptional regulator [Acuticoccus kalidii]
MEATTVFDPLEKRSLGAQAYERIRHALTVGELCPGQALTYRGMAALLNTSVTPVREAMLQLLAENVLIDGPGRSISVPILTVDKIEELKKIRMLTEVYAATCALNLINDDVIEALEEAHSKMVHSATVGERSKHNRDFHFILYRHSAMATLVEIIESVWLRAGPMNYYVFRNARKLLGNEAEASGRKRVHPHVDAVAGLKRNDPQLLTSAIQRDINESIRVSILAMQQIDDQS